LNVTQKETQPEVGEVREIECLRRNPHSEVAQKTDEFIKKKKTKKEKSAVSRVLM
jgi:hypothetical protein